MGEDCRVGEGTVSDPPEGSGSRELLGSSFLRSAQDVLGRDPLVDELRAGLRTGRPAIRAVPTSPGSDG